MVGHASVARLDPHSYADSEQPVTERIDLALRVDFAQRVLSGEALLTLREASTGPLDLDTRDLRIGAVETPDKKPLRYELAAPERILGTRLRVHLPSGTRAIRVRYATSPEASALQWLGPSQTAGGQHPYLYSQCQPIHARSLAPLQDNARIRIRAGARFTVYAERRILEALEGTEAAELHAAVGLHELEVSLQRFAQRPELTRLRTEMKDVDPDEAYSTVPYEKGYLFLRRLEELAGRDRWDRFLRDYLERFRFQSIVTDDFLRFLDERLPGVSARAGATRWIDGPGLPPDAPRPQSRRLDELREMARRVGEGVLPDENAAVRLQPTELLVFLQSLPELPPEVCDQLDSLLGLSRRRSLELRHTFVLVQLRAGVEAGRDAARRLLRETGRMKYLRHVYTELARRPQTRALAREIYDEARASYHPIARTVVESILG